MIFLSRDLIRKSRQPLKVRCVILTPVMTTIRVFLHMKAQYVSSCFSKVERKEHNMRQCYISMSDFAVERYSGLGVS